MQITRLHNGDIQCHCVDMVLSRTVFKFAVKSEEYEQMKLDFIEMLNRVDDLKDNITQITTPKFGVSVKNDNTYCHFRYREAEGYLSDFWVQSNRFQTLKAHVNEIFEKFKL